jgi:hypothetical protein
MEDFENEILIRRVPINPDCIKPDGTASSGNFKKRSKDHDGLSVDIKSLTNYSDAILDKERFVLAEIPAEILIDLGLEIKHAPVEGNNAHALVDGNLNKNTARKLASFSRIIKEEDW